MEALPSPDYIPGPEAPPSPDYIPGPEAPPLPDYIPGPEGDDDAYDDGDDLSEDDADDEDEEESSDSEEEEEEHLALTVPTPALHSSIPASEDSDETEPFEEGKTAATPPPFGYRVVARISVQPHVLMPFRSESEVERLLAIPTPPLSPVSPTSYPLPLFLMPLPLFTPLPTSSFPLLCRYRLLLIGEGSVAAAARHIRPALTITDSRRAEDRLIGKLRRESTLVSQIEALQRDVITLQRQHIDDEDRLTRHIQHEHVQRDVAPEDKMAPKRARTTRANPDPTRTTTATEPMTQESISNLIAQHVAEALAKYETQRNSVVNGDTSNTTGIGPRTVRPTWECTYKDYLNSGLENQVKFASCTLIGSALTWWNSHLREVSQEVAYTMPWRTLKQMMTAKNCPRGEIKKLEVELWNLKESDEIERYVGGLREMIRGNVMSYEPKSMQKAIASANDQMDQKLLGIADRQADNKRKFDNTSKNQQNQQPFRRNNNVTQAYAAGSGEKPYGGTKPLSRAANTKNNNNNNNNNNRRATTTYQGVPTCFECGAQDGLGTAVGNPDANVVTELGSFDVIIGMDWLKTYHAVIVCDEKIIRVPFGNETLIIRYDGSNNGNQLNIISCTKTQKYLLKGYPVFLANITTKMIKDKSEEKRLEDVPIVRDFSEVLPEDLPGLLPTRQVEFQINLIAGAAPVAWAPYRLAPSEMKELSDKLQELFEKAL
nr:reverse transcriptase domain-containing protein [Tanacetum cinerariifolium]